MNRRGFLAVLAAGAGAAATGFTGMKLLQNDGVALISAAHPFSNLPVMEVDLDPAALEEIPDAVFGPRLVTLAQMRAVLEPALTKYFDEAWNESDWERVYA